jgi:hypothetical protein
MSRARIAPLIAAFVTSLMFAAAAQALTVGEVATVEPSTDCESFSVPVFLAQTGSSGGTFTVPSAGVVTRWSTSFGAPGTPVSMIVLRPGSPPGTFTLVGGDSETLPTPIPAGHVSTFTVATPFLAEAGDVLGMQIGPKSKAACAFETASKSDTFEFGLGHELTPGSTFTASEAGEKARVNVAIELTQSADLALTQTVKPSPVLSGGVALLALGASNASGVPIAATVSDVLPSSLPVLAAGIAGQGECSTAGQAVTCELAAVSSTPTAVDIVVSTPTAGSFTNQALISSELEDPNPSNNSAGATVVVQAPPLSSPAPTPPTCTVISLTKAPLNVAEAALRALHCGIGKVTKTASKTVPKGLVVSTNPKPGTTAAAGTLVAIKVSSGKPKRKKRRKHH